METKKKTRVKKKITWQMVYTKFKETHPRLSKLAYHFQPYDYATILIFLKGGHKLTYNYDTCRVNFTPLIHSAPKRQIIL